MEVTDQGGVRLHLSTRAIAQTQEAVHLIEQKERLETALFSSDAPLSLDLSKAWLESIFKTIINDRVGGEELNKIEFLPLFTKVKNLVSFSDDSFANERLERVAKSIVVATGELRNRFGAASHGDDGFHQNRIEMSGVEFIASAVDGLAACLYSRHRATIHPGIAERIQYSDFEEFNDWADEQFEGYELNLGNGQFMNFTYSELLYKQDIEAYKEMLIQYLSSEEDDDDE